MPTEPLLFIKPASSVVAIEGGFSIPEDRGVVHYEAEIAVLIGKPLSRNPSLEEARDAISGFAPALDLTLRDVQARLRRRAGPGKSPRPSTVPACWRPSCRAMPSRRSTTSASA